MLNGDSCDSMYANPIQKTNQVKRCRPQVLLPSRLWVAEGEIAPNGRNRGGGLEMSNHQMGSCMFMWKIYGRRQLLPVNSMGFHGCCVISPGEGGLGFCRPPKAVRAARILSSADRWFTDDTGKSKSKKDRSWNYSSGFLLAFCLSNVFFFGFYSRFMRESQQD